MAPARRVRCQPRCDESRLALASEAWNSGRLGGFSRSSSRSAWSPGPTAAASPLRAPQPRDSALEHRSHTRVWTIFHRAHTGRTRTAYLLLPAWYGPTRHPRIPLVISPHGRGVDGHANLKLGDLPGIGGFAIVNPDGEGNRLGEHSWGAPGQIDDLARMPAIVRRALPWLAIDTKRIYALGGSMGGQETLLLLAKHPRLLAGAAAFDSVADFAHQYRQFPRLQVRRRLPCQPRALNGCRAVLQGLAEPRSAALRTTCPSVRGPQSGDYARLWRNRVCRCSSGGAALTASSSIRADSRAGCSRGSGGSTPSRRSLGSRAPGRTAPRCAPPRGSRSPSPGSASCRRGSTSLGTRRCARRRDAGARLRASVIRRVARPPACDARR